MPESVNTVIPTEEELKLRVGEPADRLLGSSPYELKTRGQRLDFIEKAEDEAYKEYTSLLVSRANKLINSEILNDAEKAQITQLIENAVHSIKDLNETIETYEKKVEDAQNSPQNTGYIEDDIIDLWRKIRKGGYDEDDVDSLRGMIATYKESGDDIKFIETIERRLHEVIASRTETSDKKPSPVNTLILRDYENSLAFGQKDTNQDISDLVDQLSNSLFPEGLPEEVEIVPHTQTLGGQGNVFMVVDKREQIPQVKYIKVELTGMNIQRDTRLLLELQRDFEFQVGLAGKEMNVKDSQGNSHDANVVEQVVQMKNNLNAIVMKQVIDSQNLLPQLELSQQEKNTFLRKSSEQIVSFLHQFLNTHPNPGSFPKDWGFETIKTSKPELKGLGFFPESLNDSEPQIGIYDFSIEDRPYFPPKERSFLSIIPAFLLATSGHSDLLKVLDNLPPSSLRQLAEWPEVQMRFAESLQEKKIELARVFEELGFPQMLSALEAALNDPPQELRGKREWTKQALGFISSAINN